MSEEVSENSAKPPRFTLAALFVVMVLIAVFLAITLPGVRSARENARRAQCSNNLKMLSLALLNYQGTHGCFPPAYVADAQGKPMHSWRVLIVPYIESSDFMSRYSMQEPWDGPSNRKLIATGFAGYVCPCDEHASLQGHTSYVAIVGPGTMWPGATSGAAKHLQDGPLLIVEVVNSGIAWTEPRDLDLAQLTGVNTPNGHGPSSGHIGGALVARADGSIDFLPNSITVAELRDLLKRK